LVQRFVETNNYDVSLLDICRITDVMSEYAIKGRTKEVIQKLEAIDSYLNQKKSKVLND